jgi:ATP-dependent DNA helicase RecQ
LGEKTERILKFDHHRVSTFGIGDELDKLEWKAVFRQLLSAGYLKADLNSYGGFRLSEKSRFVLRKKQKILFRKDSFFEVKTRFVRH